MIGRSPDGLSIAQDLALAEFKRNHIVQDRLDPASHPIGRFCLFDPNKLEHARDVFTCGLMEQQVAENGRGIPRQRRFPLLGVFRALPFCFVG
jgi:hypothetical protein